MTFAAKNLPAGFTLDAKRGLITGSLKTARKKPYELMGDILKKQARDIVFSICQYGAGNVWEWGREQYSGPRGWNGTDMLVAGMVGWSQGVSIFRHPM